MNRKSRSQRNAQPQTKKMVIVRGKGTPGETRIETDIDLYWSETALRWVTIPE